MRGHCFYQVINNNSGTALPNVTVQVTYSETGLSYDGTIYQDATSSNTWTNPYTAPQGTVDFYLDQDAVIDLQVSYKSFSNTVRYIAVSDPDKSNGLQVISSGNGTLVIG